MTDETVRCYAHDFDPAHQGELHGQRRDGWPAHTWEAGSSSGRGCRQCVKQFNDGDRYVCIAGGVIHTDCVSALDADVMTPGTPPRPRRPHP